MCKNILALSHDLPSNGTRTGMWSLAFISGREPRCHVGALCRIFSTFPKLRTRNFCLYFLQRRTPIPTSTPLRACCIRNPAWKTCTMTRRSDSSRARKLPKNEKLHHKMRRCFMNIRQFHALQIVPVRPPTIQSMITLFRLPRMAG